MNSKLERLALAIKRPPSFEQEWEDPDAFYKQTSKVEIEERMKKDFPFDDPTVRGVKEFYSGKDIFITGGTGFVGKVLIEKILRSLPEAGKVYLLLRGRKGLSPQHRVKAMLELPLFKLLMTENPEAAERLVVVDGDVSFLGLGLSPADRKTLVENVSIVFHCAATVRFDLPTDHMIMVNTRGTREVVRLCKELKNLESLVHVSTTYTNSTKGRTTSIPEKVTRQSVDWRTVIAVAEGLERHPEDKIALDLIFEKLAPVQQNNYTFSKALSEDIIMDEAKDLPAIIVRPPVVLPTFEEPFGGWIDNLYGPMGFWDGAGQGVIRIHLGDPDNRLEYQPVDINVKNLIIAGWHRGIGFRTSSVLEEVDVINNGTKDIGTHTVRIMHSKKDRLYEKCSHRFILRYPRAYMSKSFLIFWLITIFSHLPLGLLVDVALRLKGEKPRLMKIYRKIYWAQAKVLYAFCNNVYDFDQEWQYRILARMWRKEDRDRFDWVTKNYAMAYYLDVAEGIIKFVFKEEAVPQEKSNQRVMWYIDWIQNAFIAYLGWCILSWISYRILAAI